MGIGRTKDERRKAKDEPRIANLLEANERFELDDRRESKAKGKRQKAKGYELLATNIKHLTDNSATIIRK